MILDLGDKDLDSTTLEAMLGSYSVGQPTRSRFNQHSVPLMGTAALSSERTQEAQNDFNFYFGMSPVTETMIDYNEDQEQIQHYAEDFEETFEQMMARYTSFYDE